MNLKGHDIGIMAVVVIIGMTLLFVLLAVKNNTIVVTIVGATVGIILLALGLGIARAPKYRSRNIVEYTDSVLIPEGSRMDIIFDPANTLVNVCLTLRSQTYHNLEVERLWCNGIETLQDCSKPLYRWHSGQRYPGPVDRDHALVIRIHNLSARVALVAARLTGRVKKA
jgi:hypothetical protein